MRKLCNELIKWTAPYAGTPLEPPVLASRVKTREDWVIRRKPIYALLELDGDPQRLYGSGLRCPRYSPASKPSLGRQGNLMLDAKQRAAGSSPAGGNRYPKFAAAIVQLVRTLDCGSRGRGFEPH